MSNALTTLRLQLLANGYRPTPNLDKRCVLKGWASPEFNERLDAAEIRGWHVDHRGFKATGLLVRDGLIAIDLDIDDADMVDAMVDRLQDIAPFVYTDAPWRTGRYPKLMILARWDRSTSYPDMFTRIATDKFIDGAGRGHMIEVFGGALTRTGSTSKQIGAFGPHSYEEDENGKINFRKVKHEYTWEEDRSPLTVPFAELPTITQEQCWALLKVFEEEAEARGWRRKVADSKAVGAFVYDITTSSRFDVENGPEQVSYTELCAMDDTHLRVSGSFIDGSSHRRDKCRVSWCVKAQAVGVWDTETAAWHLPVEAEPPSTEEHTKALQEGLARLLEAREPTKAHDMPDKPKATDGLTAQAYWLLETHAYCPPNHSVVELFTPSDACELRPQAFQHQYLAWREETEGPRGGKQVALATSAWSIHPERPTVRGVRMRPDKDFPLYQEGGDLYKNTYLKPVHVGEGEIDTFFDFLEHLLPVKEERHWFLGWLAHKHRFPDIPSIAIVMVAANDEGAVYGAGRGMLRDILARLLGQRYVRTIDFDVFSGRSAQGVYTDWGAYATLVTVSESKDAPDSGRWSAQRAVYERLKEIVDPRPVQRTFMRKGLPAFEAPCFASYMVFSNNRDALQIPADDRRVTALQNGAKLPPAQAAALQAWMDQPGNIAALARHLETGDLSWFDAYTPLHTETKATMQELARSELDEAYDAVRKRIGPHRLFTGEQVRVAVLAEMGDSLGSEIIRQQVVRKMRSDTAKTPFQTPPSAGRHWILGWRGSKLSALDLTVATAQQHVAATAKVLFDQGSSVIQFPVQPSAGD
jgi:hypothetical protein